MAAHLESVARRQGRREFHAGAHRADRGSRAARRGMPDDRPPLPDPLLATLSERPLPQDPADRLQLVQPACRPIARIWSSAIAPFAELVDLATAVNAPELIGYASDQLLLDLAVWYHLAWMGESVRRNDPRVAQLDAKGRGFDAADRRLLLELVGELLAGVLPRYRALADSGQLRAGRVAVQPSDPAAAVRFRCGARVGARLPRCRWHTHYPGGARARCWHLAASRANASSACSAAAARLLAVRRRDQRRGRGRDRGCGIRLARHQRGVLRRSLECVRALPLPDDAAAHERLLNRAFALPGGNVSCFFRHDDMSRISSASPIRSGMATMRPCISCRKWNALRAQRAATRQRVLLVALDGENAWEYYPFNGWYFLSAMYAQLVDHPEAAAGDAVRTGR